MATRRDNARDFTSFRFGLDGSRPVVSECGHTDYTKHLGKLLVTITFEGSHTKGLSLTIAKASNKEVKL